MNYIEVHWSLAEDAVERQLLLVLLEETQAESVVEEADGLKAYFPVDAFSDDDWKSMYLGTSLPSYSVREVEQQNWNEEWEKNFEPIEVENRLYLRASFHPSRPDDFDREIIITPKMSFGTGHHSTTYLMLTWMLDEPVPHAPMLDMGAGTAVLAILAAQQGAPKVWAVDYDEWAYENAVENCTLNGVSEQVEVRHGGVEAIQDIQCQTLYANINRNILLDQLPTYARILNDGGALYMSGFYTEDLEVLKSAAAALGLHFEGWRERQNWVAAKWIKK
ncbi:50S ribosomal protein L11 methyltransferase [Cryomorphaceae bacterium]|nr:50S ribosomal protein L11 methyltransferase [Cryomorphaceae bacterium]